MAKSKNGGTRAYIRGRIGSDVYSIGKDGKGSRQQVVRSLAEQVSNPRSQSQMFGRMVMSTVMQAVSALSYIIDHSFDGMAKGQPSISEFIRRNYALVKADAETHPTSGNAFGLNAYQEKGVKKGAYVISDGKALVPAAAVLTAASGLLTITVTAESLTVDALRSALGFGDDDFITLVGINANGTADFCRIGINKNAGGTVVITDANISDVLTLDGNVTPVLAVAGLTVTATISSIAGNCGIIVTKKVNGAFEHSSCTLSTPTNPQYNATIAILSYPVGTQMYLNGGDLNGGGGGGSVVTDVVAFKNATSGQPDVNIVSLRQETGKVIFVGEDGEEYICKNNNEDSIGFGKWYSDMQAANITDAGVDNAPEGYTGKQIALGCWTDDNSQEYPKASQCVSWMLRHGFTWSAMFVS
jgi:hypothetical protein